jgi:hypothetical protein
MAKSFTPGQSAKTPPKDSVPAGDGLEAVDEQPQRQGEEDIPSDGRDPEADSASVRPDRTAKR